MSKWMLLREKLFLDLVREAILDLTEVQAETEVIVASIGIPVSQSELILKISGIIGTLRGGSDDFETAYPEKAESARTGRLV